jgi:hypothetical protein
VFVRVGYEHPPEYEVVYAFEHHHDRKFVVKDRHHPKWVYVHLKKHLLHVHYEVEEVVLVQEAEGWRKFI